MVENTQNTMAWLKSDILFEDWIRHSTQIMYAYIYIYINGIKICVESDAPIQTICVAVFSVDVLESLKTKASQSTLFTPKMYRFMIQLDTVEIYGE